MEAIRLVERVTDKGLLLVDPRLDKFIQQRVEILIFPTDDIEPAMKGYMRLQDSRELLPRSEVRGILEGKVWISDDFDAPLDDLDDDVDDSLL